MTHAAPWRRVPAGRFGAFLAVFALLLQLGLPLAHEPLELGFAAPLCHVGASGAGRQVPVPASPDQGTLCPICLGLAAAANAVLPPDPGHALLALVLPDAPPPARPADAQPAPALPRTAQPRAPPTVV